MLGISTRPPLPTATQGVSHRRVRPADNIGTNTEPDQNARIKMRKGHCGSFTKLALSKDDLKVRVHFKRRDVLSIASRDDGEGLGAVGRHRQVRRTGPNRVDLADIHLSITTTDAEGFWSNDKWLR